MASATGSKLIKDWPEESREAAQLVIDTYGEPHESLLTWHEVGPWGVLVGGRGDAVPSPAQPGGGAP
jgi:hypothetical protein